MIEKEGKGGRVTPESYEKRAPNTDLCLMLLFSLVIHRMIDPSVLQIVAQKLGNGYDLVALLV